MVFVICATFCKTLASRAGEQLPKRQNQGDQDNWLSYGSNLQSVNSATEEHGMESSSLENQNHQQILEHLANTIAPAIENAELGDQRSSAETRMRIAEDNYRNVLAYGAASIYQATPGGVIRSVNSVLAQMCGYESPEELMANVIDFRRQLTEVLLCDGWFVKSLSSVVVCLIPI